MAYPVSFQVARPDRYSRLQLALRVVLFLIIGLLGLSLGALFLMLYLALPAFAAITLSNDPPQRFLQRDAPRIARVLRWIMAVYAYFALLTDRLPTSEPDRDVHLDIQAEGTPTAASALWRILYGIPNAIVLAILLWVAGVAWALAFVMVLVRQRYWRGLFDFQTGVVRWMARLLAYQASLVEAYPPFSLAEATPSPAPAPGPV